MIHPACRQGEAPAALKSKTFIIIGKFLILTISVNLMLFIYTGLMVKRRTAESYLAIATLIWAGTFAIIKGALDDSSPLFFVAIRFMIAAIILTPFMYYHRKGFNKGTLLAGIVLGTIMFLGFSLQTAGLQYTTASKSGFITGLVVVFTPFLQMLIEKRVPRPGHFLGVVIVVVGLYLLTSPAGSTFNKGDALTLACAFFFALYIVYLDVFTKKYHIMHMIYMQVVVVSAWSFIFSAGFESIRFSITGNLMFALAYTAVLATVINTSLQTNFQRFTTPTRAALIFTLEPVFAALIAYFFLNEILGVKGVIGGAVIVFGLLVSELAEIIDKWSTKKWYEPERS